MGYSDPDLNLRVTQLAVPGQPRGLSSHALELAEYVHPKGRRQMPDIKNPGEAHLCVPVTDIHEHYERLVAAGIRFLSPPNAITAGVKAGGFPCYFHDPDQVVLELQQAPAHRQAAYLNRLEVSSHACAHRGAPSVLPRAPTPGTSPAGPPHSQLGDRGDLLERHVPL